MGRNIRSSDQVMINRTAKNGAALLGVTIFAILLAIGLSVAMPLATREYTREKEETLRFALGEFRRAAEKFQRCNQRLPNNIDELLSDENGSRFLRRRYIDPITGKFDWQTEISSQTFVVHSSSKEPSLAGIPYSDFR